MMGNFKPIIGMEVHVELGTAAKMFCGCPADHFAKKPNSQTCPVCLGLPGALPFPNQKAIESTLKVGLALNCRVNSESKFDRKHYFYPDLPKGYQISQYDQPFCLQGEILLSENQKIRITRVHLEEDTGKLVHVTLEGKEATLIDFNRSGVPLLEIVTEPDLKSAGEVVEFAQELQRIIRYLQVSDCDMEKGSMRLEANVSLSQGSQLPEYKVEIKNINSFRFLKKAIEAEIERQKQMLQKGKKLIQETRGYNEETGKTFSQRTKEEAQDYRYFPEPDIPPLHFSPKEIAKIKQELPELPLKKRQKFGRFNLPENYIEILTSNRQRAEYFETAMKLGQKHHLAAKSIASVMVNQNWDEKYPEPAGLISKLVAATQKEYASESDIKKILPSVLKANAKAVADFRKGKTQVLGFLVGQVQSRLKGRGNPKEIVNLLQKALEK